MMLKLWEVTLALSKIKPVNIQSWCRLTCSQIASVQTERLKYFDLPIFSLKLFTKPDHSCPQGQMLAVKFSEFNIPCKLAAFLDRLKPTASVCISLTQLRSLCWDACYPHVAWQWLRFPLSLCTITSFRSYLLIVRWRTLTKALGTGCSWKYVDKVKYLLFFITIKLPKLG